MAVMSRNEWRLRGDEVLEQVEQHLVGPVHIVDAEHHRAAVRPCLEHHGDGLVDGVPHAESIEPIDGRGVAQQVGEHVDEAFGARRVDRREHLLRPLQGGGARCIDVDARVEIEVVGQRGGDGPPHVGLAVRHAGTFQHRCLAVLANPADHLVDVAALAHAVVAVDVQQHPAAVAHQLQRCLGDGELGAPAHDAEGNSWRRRRRLPGGAVGFSVSHACSACSWPCGCNVPAGS